MNPNASFFDLFLVMTLVWLAWSSLTSRDLFKAVVLFIAFGILSALSWVRLDAPDIALAEAAIGAGLTGVLLLDAVGFLRVKDRGGRQAADSSAGPAASHSSVSLLPLVLIITGGIVAGLALKGFQGKTEELPELIEQNMPASGVSNPVTAVLLNFRGYDTLLEVGVLVIALIGVLSLRNRALMVDQPPGPPDPILSALSHLLLPVMVMVAAYLLYSGADAPGGAFQSGAVLGTSMVLLRLSGAPAPSWLRGRIAHILTALGFGTFLVMAGGVVVIGNNLLECPAGRAGIMIFVVETALAVSTAFILAELFSGWGGEDGN